LAPWVQVFIAERDRFQSWYDATISAVCTPVPDSPDMSDDWAEPMMVGVTPYSFLPALRHSDRYDCDASRYDCDASRYGCDAGRYDRDAGRKDLGARRWVLPARRASARRARHKGRM
jgi:hypothetical protein